MNARDGFKPGDVVVLKSGGPPMTVAGVGDFGTEGLGPEQGVFCVWFEKTKRFEGVFDAATLEQNGRSAD